MILGISANYRFEDRTEVVLNCMHVVLKENFTKGESGTAWVSNGLQLCQVFQMFTELNGFWCTRLFKE